MSDANVAEADDAFEIPQLYKHHAFVCLTQRPPGHPRGSCGGLGVQPLWDRLTKTIEAQRLTDIGVTAAGCFGFCSAGPMMGSIRTASGIDRPSRRISTRSSNPTSSRASVSIAWSWC